MRLVKVTDCSVVSHYVPWYFSVYSILLCLPLLPFHFSSQDCCTNVLKPLVILKSACDAGQKKNCHPAKGRCKVLTYARAPFSSESRIYGGFSEISTFDFMKLFIP